MKFQNVGMPQIQDIVKASARDILLGLDKVSDDVLPYFDEAVEEVLKKYGTKEALCRTFALVTGYTKLIRVRSLLGGCEGYITYAL